MNKLERLRESFHDKGIDALFVTNVHNVRYITDFTGDDSAALITENEALFITDSRYTEQAKMECPGYTIVERKETIIQEVARLCEQHGVKNLGFEKHHVTYAQFQQLEENVKSELVPVADLIETLRLVKTPEEIALIKVAADIADAAFHHILQFIKPGVTELDVANELEFFMRKAGAASSSFPTIVASGARSALPHGVATDKVIEKGDMVTLDYGAVYKGYVSDMTRTIAVGDPGEQMKEIYDVVLGAQLKGVGGIRAGITGKEADALCRDYIEEHGYGKYFGHSTGHGIGLEVHEGPALSHRSDLVLQPGMVVTCEPGIYLEGVGGVRIEDDLIITDDGNEVIIHSPKELIIL